MTEKESKKPFEIEITSVAYDLGEEELVNVLIKAKDQLDAVVLAASIVKSMKFELKKEPEVKILP